MPTIRTIIHNINNKLHRRARREQRWRVTLWWIAALIIGLVSVDVHWSQGALDFQYARPNQAKIRQVSSWMDQEARRLQSAAQGMADDDEIRQLIANDDEEDLRGIIEARQQKIGASGIAIVDAKGVALVRTQAPGIRGDVVFESIAWGRQLAAGHSVATVEAGTVYPLLLLGAVPIMDHGQVVGGIAIGENINDSFLRQALLPFLPAHTIVSSFMYDRGLLSSTTQNDAARSGLQTYLNPGADGMTGSEPGNKLIVLDGKKYTATRITFPGLEAPIGGLLYLFPFHELTRTILLALLEALVIGAITFALIVSAPHRTRHWWLLALAGGLALLIRAGMTTYIPNSRTIFIDRPAFTMYNSTLAIDPPSRIYDRHYDQQVNLTIDSGGEPVNAVQVVIDFDPIVVQIKKVDLSSSICRPDLVVENTIDPKGRVTITCGTPTPGYNKSGGIIATLTLSPLAPGRTTLHYDVKTNVRANDGIGTNVLRLATDGNYYFVDGDPATQPTIYSPTNPNSDQWYNSKEVRMTWSGFGPIVRYSFSQNPNDVPGTILVNSTAALTLRPATDGVYYFKLQSLTNGVYGPVYQFPVRVDIGAPKLVQINTASRVVRPGAIVRAHLQASDSTSGLQRTFYLRVDKGVFYPVGADVNLSFDKKGSHTLTLRALDQAGNYRDASTVIQVKK